MNGERPVAPANARAFAAPRLRTPPSVWGRRILRNWPFLLWVGVLVYIAAFYSRNQQFGEIAGTVEVVEEAIAPLETARLLSVAVQPGQVVKAREVVAQMDTTLVDAELAVQQSTVRDGRDNATTYQQAMLRASVQAALAARTAEASLRAAQLQQQRESAELEQLQAELKRREDLLAKRLIDELQVSELRPQIAALGKSLAATPQLIAAYQQAWDEATRHEGLMQAWLRTDGSHPLAAAVSNKTESSTAILEAQRDVVLRRKEAYTLRASRDGVVGRLFVQPGNAVAAGIPVLNVVDIHPRRVIGFLPEAHPVNLTAGEQALVWRQNGGGRAVQAVVASVEPMVEALPTRISPMQVQSQGGQPLRGRRIIIDLVGTHDLQPGETVEIRPVPRGWLAWLDDLERVLSGH